MLRHRKLDVVRKTWVFAEMVTINSCIKVPQNAPEANDESVKCKNFLEQHSQVPESALESAKKL